MRVGGTGWGSILSRYERGKPSSFPLSIRVTHETTGVEKQGAGQRRHWSRDPVGSPGRSTSPCPALHGNFKDKDLVAQACVSVNRSDEHVRQRVMRQCCYEQQVKVDLKAQG